MLKTMNSVKPPRMTALRELHEAENGSPLSILIGTILSARTRDENTSAVVKKLFSRYKTARALASAKLVDVEKIIKSTGFYRVKARRIIEVASIINSKYSGKVPQTIDKLLELPGVGRKTANCVLVYAFDKPAIPVDVHVHRISNRLGLVSTKMPEQTELELSKLVDRRLWTKVNNTLVMYGQNICLPVRPNCKACPLKRMCRIYSRQASSSWTSGVLLLGTQLLTSHQQAQAKAETGPNSPTAFQRRW